MPSICGWLNLVSFPLQLIKINEKKNLRKWLLSYFGKPSRPGEKKLLDYLVRVSGKLHLCSHCCCEKGWHRYVSLTAVKILKSLFLNIIRLIPRQFVIIISQFCSVFIPVIISFLPCIYEICKAGITTSVLQGEEADAERIMLEILLTEICVACITWVLVC